MSPKWVWPSFVLNIIGNSLIVVCHDLLTHCEFDSIFSEKLLEIAQIVKDLPFLKQEVSIYFFVYSSFDFILLFYNITEARLVLALM